jgi:hypothetical protein
LEEAVKPKDNKFGYNTDDKKLEPDIIGKDIVDDTEKGVNKNDGPDDIIRLVPSFL